MNAFHAVSVWRLATIANVRVQALPANQLFNPRSQERFFLAGRAYTLALATVAKRHTLVV